MFMKRLKASLIDSFCRDIDDEANWNVASDILSRIHCISRVKSDRIGALLQRASVVLQPFPFAGSKTASDAIRPGVPPVTLPQAYLRSRLAQTFYTTMELHLVDPEVAASRCCVASSVSDYVSKALRLGLDKEYRHEVAGAILKRRHRIFDDEQTSYEWARFLTRANGLVFSNEELAIDMKYRPESWQSEESLSKQILAEQRSWKKSKLLYAFE